MPETTRLGLQERQDATRKGLEAKKPLPLILTASAESFNATNDQNSSSPAVRSKSYSHCGSGYNSRKRARISGIGWLRFKKTSIPPPIKIGGLLEVTL